MERKKFIKNLVVLGLAGPILAACGELPTNQPAVTVTINTPSATTPANTTTATTLAASVASTSSPLPATQTTTAVNPGSQAKPTNEPILLHFNEFYSPDSTSIDLKLSEKLKSANGKMIRITGYMAPPLKPALDFFVLTRIKLAVCPFCSTAADWPEDILLVTMQNGKKTQQVEDPVTIVGKLEIGETVDSQTGFFSLLRLRAESVDVFKGS